MFTVSLILTTYNSENNLPNTLNSIEMQDYPNIEVNIKDGGSGIPFFKDSIQSNVWTNKKISGWTLSYIRNNMV